MIGEDRFGRPTRTLPEAFVDLDAAVRAGAESIGGGVGEVLALGPSRHRRSPGSVRYDVVSASGRRTVLRFHLVASGDSPGLFEVDADPRSLHEPERVSPEGAGRVAARLEEFERGADEVTRWNVPGIGPLTPITPVSNPTVVRLAAAAEGSSLLAELPADADDAAVFRLVRERGGVSSRVEVALLEVVAGSYRTVDEEDAEDLLRVLAEVESGVPLGWATRRGLGTGDAS